MPNPETTPTLSDEIYAWAEAHYDESHTAQAVVEGCWEKEELEAEGSMAEWLKTVALLDDRYEDISSTAW